MSHTLTISDIYLDEKIIVDYKKIQKMAFIYDALDNGWTVQKLKNDTYEFTKENSKKIDFSKFLKKHMKTNNIIKKSIS